MCGLFACLLRTHSFTKVVHTGAGLDRELASSSLLQGGGESSGGLNAEGTAMFM